jgi:class 3 adenylate cyclase
MRSETPTERSELASGDALPREANVTLLFCDVVRSTELTRRLGDGGAYRLIRGFHDTVLRVCAPCGGEELELRGDGVLLAFETPRPALRCAIEIQRSLLEAPRGRRINVRIGIHDGPALRVETGYFGANVILSARIAAAAAPGEILVSAALVRGLADEPLEIDAGRWVSLKGIPEPSLVFSIPWRSHRRRIVEPPCPSLAHEALLSAVERGRESDPNDEEPSCMLGRRSAV